MIPGSTTGTHPDDGCGFGDFKIMTTDSSHKLENGKAVTGKACSIKSRSESLAIQHRL
jgi:hypothetical protein